MAYNGEHGLYFETIGGETVVNTWDDWHLIPTSRPTMSLPAAQNRFVEIPGMNGSYDISEYLTTDVTFADRSGSFEFVVDNGHEDWITIYQKIASFLHGRNLALRLADDPEWYYRGRFTLDEWKSEAARSKISISYRVNPFKYSVYGSYFPEDVIWDLFCFERDADLSKFYHMQVSGTSTYRIDPGGYRSSIVARLISGGPVTTTVNGITTTLPSSGSTITIGTVAPTKTTDVKVSGTGVIDLGWQKMSL